MNFIHPIAIANVSMHINHTRSTRPSLKVKARHPRKHLFSRKNLKMQFTVLNIFQCTFCFTLTLKKCKIAWANVPVINSSMQYEASGKETVWSMRRCFDARKIIIHLKQLKAYLIVGLLPRANLKRSKWHTRLHTRSECCLQLQGLTQVHWYFMDLCSSSRRRTCLIYLICNFKII